jgi:hypothetical protein
VSRLSLIPELAHWCIAPVKRKGFFSGEYVLFAEYLSHAQLLYETSAVLGYIYRDRLGTFTELFSEPGRQADVTNLLVSGRYVADRLAGLPDEPENFNDLFFTPELMVQARNFGLTQFSELPKYPDICRKVFTLKMPGQVAFEHSTVTFLEGIQLGSQYPELTEKLFSYKHDTEKWRFAYEHGVEVGPSPPETIPLKERQVEVMTFIKPFIEKARPDLLSKLGFGA